MSVLDWVCTDLAHNLVGRVHFAPVACGDQGFVSGDFTQQCMARKPYQEFAGCEPLSLGSFLARCTFLRSRETAGTCQLALSNGLKEPKRRSVSMTLDVVGHSLSVHEQRVVPSHRKYCVQRGKGWP